MTETQWVKELAPKIQNKLEKSRLSVTAGKKLPYAYEVLAYDENSKPAQSLPTEYQTDMLITENVDGGKWIPRVVIEAKLRSVTTHDAITYSHKAFTHRQVHPYIRYGILVGQREHYPLPGRLFRHGTQFDFMVSWVKLEPTKKEMDCLINILTREIEASQIMEHIIFDSRQRNRAHYTALHKELRLH